MFHSAKYHFGAAAVPALARTYLTVHRWTSCSVVRATAGPLRLPVCAANPGTPVTLNSESPVYASNNSQVAGIPVSPPPADATSIGG